MPDTSGYVDLTEQAPQGPPASMRPGPSFVGPPQETSMMPQEFTPEFWQEKLGKPLDKIGHALSYIRRPIDIAANYYSGATNALDPHTEPVPIPELAKEALLPSEKLPTPIPGLGLVPGMEGIGAIQEMQAATGTGAGALRETGDIAARAARPLVGFGAGLASDPTTYGALGILKKAGATGEALHGLLSAAFAGTMGKGAVDAANQVAQKIEESGFSRELIEPSINLILNAVGAGMGAHGAIKEAGALGDRMETTRQARLDEVAGHDVFAQESAAPAPEPVTPQVQAPLPPTAPPEPPARAVSVPERVRPAMNPDAAELAGSYGSPGEVGAVRIGEPRKIVELRATGEQGVVVSVTKDGTATVEFPSGTKEVRGRDVNIVGQEPLGGMKPGRGPEPLPQPAPAPPPKPAEIVKLVEAIKAAKPVRKMQEQLYTAERARRAEKLGKVYETPRGEANLQEAKAALGGELPKAGGFEGVRGKLTPEEVTALHDTISTHKGIDKFERVRAGDALNKILDQGKVPQESELQLLHEIFGQDVTDAVLQHQSLGKKLVDYLNAPRALKSAIDMSAPLRQGLILSVGHPASAWSAFKEMHKAFFKEGAAQQVRDQIRSSPNAQLYKSSGLYLAKRIGKREESFMSRLAEKVPGVERSERAYETYLNKLRMDTFDSMVKDAGAALDGTGKMLELGDHKAIADFVNKASGRGSLGPLDRAAPILNTVFFAPRFVASRFQVFDPTVYTKLPPGARQHAIRSMVGTVGLVTTALALAKMSGAKVEDDVRSTDFGKVRVGNTRVDLWGGVLPEVRVLGQIVAGERKTQDGKVKPSTAADTLAHFTRGKLAPGPGVLADVATEKTYSGGEVTPLGEASSLFAPMFLADIADTFGSKGHPELLPLAFYGAGVSTYHPAHVVATATKKHGLVNMLRRGVKTDQKAISKFFYGLRKSEKKPPEANQ